MTIQTSLTYSKRWSGHTAALHVLESHNTGNHFLYITLWLLDEPLYTGCPDRSRKSEPFQGQWCVMTSTMWLWMLHFIAWQLRERRSQPSCTQSIVYFMHQSVFNSRGAMTALIKHIHKWYSCWSAAIMQRETKERNQITLSLLISNLCPISTEVIYSLVKQQRYSIGVFLLGDNEATTVMKNRNAFPLLFFFRILASIGQQSFWCFYTTLPKNDIATTSPVCYCDSTCHTHKQTSNTRMWASASEWPCPQRAWRHAVTWVKPLCSLLPQ